MERIIKKFLVGLVEVQGSGMKTEFTFSGFTAFIGLKRKELIFFLFNTFQIFSD